MKNISFTLSIYLLLLSLVSAVTFAFVNIDNIEKKTTSDVFLEVTIEEGDSIWALFADYKEKHNLSYDQFIQWVDAHNQTNLAKLYPGERLFLPVHQKDLEQIKVYASSEGN
ncbi:hypothetical protein LCL95_03825 [Bacillus timonensis]|nr:hypothetical protein [Bacillus timonensis]